MGNLSLFFNKEPILIGQWTVFAKIKHIYFRGKYQEHHDHTGKKSVMRKVIAMVKQLGIPTWYEFIMVTLPSLGGVMWHSVQCLISGVLGIYIASSSFVFLGFTWRHKLFLNQCPPCWCPSGVKFMLIIVYFYSDASLLSLIISPTTGISRNKKVDKKPGIHLKVSQCSLGMLKA